MRDLAPGMLLEGVVTNVANFGAFVDIGVHQDGLVHVSQLADRFVKDPREVRQSGRHRQGEGRRRDLKRKRIALTMKLTEPAAPVKTSERRPPPSAPRPTPPTPTPPAPSTSMAAAFSKLRPK